MEGGGGGGGHDAVGSSSMVRNLILTAGALGAAFGSRVGYLWLRLYMHLLARLIRNRESCMFVTWFHQYTGWTWWLGMYKTLSWGCGSLCFEVDSLPCNALDSSIRNRFCSSSFSTPRIAFAARRTKSRGRR